MSEKVDLTCRSPVDICGWHSIRLSLGPSLAGTGREDMAEFPSLYLTVHTCRIVNSWETHAYCYRVNLLYGYIDPHYVVCRIGNPGIVPHWDEPIKKLIHDRYSYAVCGTCITPNIKLKCFPAVSDIMWCVSLQ